MQLGINHADVNRSAMQVFFAKEKFTVFFNVQDSGGQQLANWKESEVYTDKEEHKNAGYVQAERGTVITNEIQKCQFVTVEAESSEEAIRACRTFFQGGVNRPGTNVPATPAVGLTGGFANQDWLACKTSSLTEAVPIP